MNHVTETTTVSAKISKELRKKLEKYQVPISEVIRSALEDEIRKKEREILAGNLDDASALLKKVPKGLVTDIIREDRNTR
jgi:post-segregation antitoxin (ccd killing protein)